MDTTYCPQHECADDTKQQTSQDANAKPDIRQGMPAVTVVVRNRAQTSDLKEDNIFNTGGYRKSTVYTVTFDTKRVSPAGWPVQTLTPFYKAGSLATREVQLRVTLWWKSHRSSSGV